MYLDTYSYREREYNNPAQFIIENENISLICKAKAPKNTR